MCVYNGSKLPQKPSIYQFVEIAVNATAGHLSHEILICSQ